MLKMMAKQFTYLKNEQKNDLSVSRDLFHPCALSHIVRMTGEVKSLYFDVNRACKTHYEITVVYRPEY